MSFITSSIDNFAPINSLVLKDSIFEFYPYILFTCSNRKGQVLTNLDSYGYGSPISVYIEIENKKYQINGGIITRKAANLETLQNPPGFHSDYAIQLFPMSYFNIQDGVYSLPPQYGLTKKIKELLSFFGSNEVSSLLNDNRYKYLAFSGRLDEFLIKFTKRIRALDNSPLFFFMNINGHVRLRSYFDLMNQHYKKEFNFNKGILETLTGIEFGMKPESNNYSVLEGVDYNIDDWSYKKTTYKISENYNNYILTDVENKEKISLVGANTNKIIEDEIYNDNYVLNMVGKNLFNIRLSILTIYNLDLMAGDVIYIRYLGKVKNFIHNIDGKWLILESNHVWDSLRNQKYTMIVVGRNSL
jgi:hypothetical protein